MEEEWRGNQIRNDEHRSGYKQNWDLQGTRIGKRRNKINEIIIIIIFKE